MRTRSPGSWKGRGRSRTAFTMLKIAVVAPMPSARTLTTATAKDGARDIARNAERRSANKIRIRESPRDDPCGNELERTGGGAATQRIVCHQKHAWLR